MNDLADDGFASHLADWAATLGAPANSPDALIAEAVA